MRILSFFVFKTLRYRIDFDNETQSGKSRYSRAKNLKLGY